MGTAAIRRFSFPAADAPVERAGAMAREICDLAAPTVRRRNVWPQIVERLRDGEPMHTSRHAFGRGP